GSYPGGGWRFRPILHGSCQIIDLNSVHLKVVVALAGAVHKHALSLGLRGQSSASTAERGGIRHALCDSRRKPDDLCVIASDQGKAGRARIADEAAEGIDIR